jgi:hypothetical protein
MKPSEEFPHLPADIAAALDEYDRRRLAGELPDDDDCPRNCPAAEAHMLHVATHTRGIVDSSGRDMSFPAHRGEPMPCVSPATCPELNDWMLESVRSESYKY